MVEYSLFQEACVMAVYLLAIPLFGAVVGGLLAGIIQTLFSISDTAIGVFGRLLGVSASLFFFGAEIYRQISSFSDRVWGADYWVAF